MFFNRSREFKFDSFQNILFLAEEIVSMTQDAQCIVSESVKLQQILLHVHISSLISEREMPNAMKIA